MSDTEAAARQDYADYAGEIGNISLPYSPPFRYGPRTAVASTDRPSSGALPPK